MIREALDAAVRGLDGLVCDMDGVLYRGTRPIAGAAEAVASLRDAGVRIVFCTNNSGETVTDYVARLERIGIPAGAEEVLTSAVVTAETLAARGFIGKRALVLGGRGLRHALAESGIEEVDESASGADVVVVGLDTSFDYAAMRLANDAVRAGASFVATNDDATLPVEDGFWPGAGAILASIETACGRRAEVMGKPHAPMLDAAAQRLQGARWIAALGDRPETDLAGASARGWTTVLVLSGVTSCAEAAQLQPAPDVVVESLKDLVTS